MGIIIFRDSVQGKRLLGRIDYEIEGNSTFQYDEGYLSQAEAFDELGISERLPLGPNPYSSADFAPFFRGILPEGETYEDLIDMYQLPRNAYLSLLEQLGCESIGALTFLSESVDPNDYKPAYRHLEEDRVEQLRRTPVRGVVQEVGETRLSLSGAQSKVAWFLPEGKSAGVAPYQKYQEHEEGNYLCMIAELLEGVSDNPIADKQEFAKRLVFDFVVGNSDAHLKNSSLLYNKSWNGRRLAPRYDVTCIPLTGYSTKMPFKIGEHRELSEIDENDLMSIPLDLDVPLDVFDGLVMEVVEALESYNSGSDDPAVANMVQRILDNAQPRMKVVKRWIERYVCSG